MLAALPQILELIPQLVPPVLDPRDLAEVIEGVARVISVLKPEEHELVQRYTTQLLTPFASA
jgi:hypothetical protein